MTDFNLSLLGGIRIEDESGTPISIPAKKSEALLTYLALHLEKPQAREKLATLLWEDSNVAQARHSLRQALSDLRNALGPNLVEDLIGNGDTLTLNPGVFDVDVHRFTQLAESSDLECLQQAVDLYHGEFLEGFNPRAMLYEDWLMSVRSHLRELVLNTMNTLVVHYSDTRDTERAIHMGIRIVGMDPLQESAHRALMQLYASTGRPAAALKQYRACCQILERELGVGPEKETELLFEEIRKKRDDMPRQSTENSEEALVVESVPSIDPDQSISAIPVAPEYRQVTVLSVTLANSNRTSSGIDPEIWLENLNQFYESVTQEVVHFGGGIAKCLEETIVAAFGIPAAHSKDSERAVMCATRIHRAIAESVFPSNIKGLSVGIASGLVILQTAEDLSQEITITGQSVQTSLTLSLRARPGETRITREVYNTIGSDIACEAVNDSSEDNSLDEWLVSKATGSSPDPAKTRFVGRLLESRQLTGALELTIETHRGQMILIRGDAGIGKTRLLEEFRVLAEREGAEWCSAHILDFGGRIEQEPILNLVHSILGASPAAEEDERRKAVELLLNRGPLESPEDVLINDLLGLAQTKNQQVRFEGMDNTARHQGRQELIHRILEARCLRGPIVLSVEDIHWANSITMTVLASIATAVSGLPALLVGTSRVEDEGTEAHLGSMGAIRQLPMTTINLAPFQEVEALELASQWSEENITFVKQCVTRAEGNPLFLEQLLRSDDGKSEAVPDSIQSTVRMRLDRLSSKDLEAIQVASVMGQSFDLVSIRNMIEDPEYTCRGLVAQHFVRFEGEHYRFIHALIQEGIYSSIPGSRRLNTHLKFAEWFAGKDSTLRAGHLERAGDSAAARAYLDAAREARARFRYIQGVELARRGLDLSADPSDRIEFTLTLGELLREIGEIESSIETFKSALNAAVDADQKTLAIIGISEGLRFKSQQEDALEFIAQASQFVGEDSSPEVISRFHLLRGNLMFPLGRIDECLKAHKLAHEFAKQADSPNLVAMALNGLGDAFYQRGQMASSAGYFGKCVRFCHANGLKHTEANTLAMQGVSQWFMNQTVTALEACNSALALGSALRAQRAVFLAQNVLGIVLLYHLELESAAKHIKESIQIARDLGSEVFAAANTAWLGMILAAQNKRKRGAKLAAQAVETSKKFGSKYFGPIAHGALAYSTDDHHVRAQALQEGEALLQNDCVSHNYLIFYQIAMEVSLDQSDWEGTERYAKALEEYTHDEPLPWSRYFINRSKALVQFGRGDKSPNLMQSLQEIQMEGERSGLQIAVPKLEAALSRHNNTIGIG